MFPKHWKILLISCLLFSISAVKSQDTISFKVSEYTTTKILNTKNKSSIRVDSAVYELHVSILDKDLHRIIAFKKNESTKLYKITETQVYGVNDDNKLKIGPIQSSESIILRTLFPYKEIVNFPEYREKTMSIDTLSNKPQLHIELSSASMGSRHQIEYKQDKVEFFPYFIKCDYSFVDRVTSAMSYPRTYKHKILKFTSL